jgi:hypothetical protein
VLEQPAREGLPVVLLQRFRTGRCLTVVRFVLVVMLAACARAPATPIEKLRHQVAEVTARAHAVMAAAHTDAELRAAQATLTDLQLELADLSERIERVALQSQR